MKSLFLSTSHINEDLTWNKYGYPEKLILHRGSVFCKLLADPADVSDGYW